MAQHDYTIANQTFPATRTDLNNALAATVTQNSGATAPSTTYAYMLWYDTTANILKQRNANDDAWIDLFDVDQVADTATPSTGGAGTAQGSNLIINGAMQVWQRGTSQSSNNYSSVDRWTFYAGSGMSVSQSTDVPSEFKYSCSFGGTGNSSGLTTRLEGQDCARLVGKDITVSFYLKQTTGAGSGAIVVALLYADTLDNFGGTTYIGQPTVDTTSDWVRYEVTFTNLPAQAANGLALNFKTPSSSAVVFLITGVQLEIGDTATPFEHRSYGDELARCQRYTYIMSSNTSSHTTEFINGAAYSASQVNAGIDLPVTMRATPTVTYGNDTGAYRFYRAGGNDPFDTLVNDNPTNLHLQFAGTAGLSHTSGVAGSVQLRYGDGAFVKADAEL